jgi:translocation and assembly module TamB
VSEPSSSSNDRTSGPGAPGPGDRSSGAADAGPGRAPPPRRRRRARRAIGWSVASLLFLVALLAGTAIILLARLDNPQVSDYLRGSLAEDYQLDLSYDALSIDVFTGMHAENLRLHTPAPYAEHAADLLHIGRVDATWDFWSFMRGEPRLGQIAIEGVTVRVVMDEHGGSSIVELARRFPAEPEEETAAVPLSHLLQDALPALAVDALTVRDVSFELIELAQQEVQRRITLGGVCMDGPFQSRPGALSTRLRLGSCADGLKLTVVEPRAADARPREMLMRLEHAMTTPAPDRVELAVQGALVRQDLVPGVALPEEVFRARLGVRFEPAANRTHVALHEARVLGGALTAEARVTLDDAPGDGAGVLVPHVERLAGQLDATKLAALAPGLLSGITLADTALTYEITDLLVDGQTFLPARGSVAVRGKVGSARVDRDGQTLALDNALLRFDLELPPQQPAQAGATAGAAGAGGATLLGQLDAGLELERLEADMGGERTSVQGLKVALTGTDLALDVANPQASRGTFAVDAALASAGAVLPDAEVELAGVRLETTITAGAAGAAGATGATGAAGTDGAAGAAGTDGAAGAAGAPRTLVQVRGELPVASLSLRQGRRGPRVQAQGVALSWRVDGLDPAFATPASVQADARLGKLDLADGGDKVALSDARARIRATVRSPSAFDASVELPVAAIDVRSADGVTLTLRDASLGVRADRMVVGDDALPRGHVAVTSSLPTLSARTPTARAEARDVGLSVETELRGSGPLTLSGTLPLGKLEVHDTAPDSPTRGELLDLDDARLTWRVEDLVMHPTDPLRTRGRVHVEGALPGFALPGEGVSVAVPALALDATAHGARKAYDARLRVDLRASTRDGERTRQSALTATVDAHADLRAPGARLNLAVRGAEGPDIQARLDAGFTPGQRKLGYEIALGADRLEAIEELLPASVRAQHQVDWQALKLRVDGHGEVRELIQRFEDGTPILAEDALAAMRGEQVLTVNLEGLDYRAGAEIVKIPALTLRLDGAREDDAAHAVIALDLPRMQVVSEGKAIEIAGLTHRLNVTSPGAPEQGRVTLESTTEIGRVEQPFIGYPVENARMVVRGHLDQMTSLYVDELRFDNPAGGTALTARLAMDQPAPASAARASADLGDRAIPGRQALTLQGDLRQDLGRIDLGKNGPRLRGRVAFPFQVESGDLTAFLIGLRAELEGVHVQMGVPGVGLAVQNVNGRIPVLVELALLPDGGVRILEGPAKNLYSRTRFLDVHPFLRGQHFLSVDRVWLGMGQPIGPIAGNLRIERDSLALDQLQLGYMDGNISGQLVVDYRNGKPRVLFRGNATGIRPDRNSDEILDANAALVFSPDPLALEGRVQVVRMGKQHLHAMLDILDPYHEDPDFNSVRLGLRVGYPEFLRLRMKDGFLDAKIDLGGAANVIRIDEIRGIALGPLLNLYVAPYLTPLAPPADDPGGAPGQPGDSPGARPAGKEEESQPTAPPAGVSPTQGGAP